MKVTGRCLRYIEHGSRKAIALYIESILLLLKTKQTNKKNNHLFYLHIMALELTLRSHLRRIIAKSHYN